jgi:hypothetical protein
MAAVDLRERSLDRMVCQVSANAAARSAGKSASFYHVAGRTLQQQPCLIGRTARKRKASYIKDVLQVRLLPSLSMRGRCVRIVGNDGLIEVLLLCTLFPQAKAPSINAFG